MVLVPDCTQSDFPSGSKPNILASLYPPLLRPLRAVHFRYAKVSPMTYSSYSSSGVGFAFRTNDRQNEESTFMAAICC